MLAEVLEYKAEEYEYKCFEELEKMLEMMWEHWLNMEEHFNNGQLTIYYFHLAPPVFDWMDYAVDSWPSVDVDMYVDGCYNCYYFDVLERAFSHAIENPLERMYEHVEKGQYYQYMSWMFEMLAIMAAVF